MTAPSGKTTRAMRFRLIVACLLIPLAATLGSNDCFGQSQTKAMQDGSQSKMQPGSQMNPAEEGSSSRNGDGSGTRNDPDSGNAPANTGSAYRPPASKQLDPELLDDALESAAKIDQLIDSALKEQKIKRNDEASDLQFARRVFLDITGTIPTGRQAVAFKKYRDKKGVSKRTVLVDDLLNSWGHVSHTFNDWSEILRLMDGIGGGVNLRPYSDWVKDSIAADMPYDQFVNELLASEGRVWENPAVGYTLRDIGMTKDNLDNTMRIFVGTRIGCAQCHDHPFDKWTQKEFYELAAFIHGTETRSSRGVVDAAIGNAKKEMSALPETIENDAMTSRLRRMIGYSEMAVGEKRGRKLRLPGDYKYENAKPGQKVDPKVTFGQPPKIQKNVPLRKTFADWVTSPENPRFTMMIVNRLWKRAFGVGLIEPIDNFTEVTEATHPELLEFLMSEMKRVNYSQREFLRILYNTELYGREAHLEDWDPNKPYWFQGPVMRRMTAQQLWDSMLTLTLAEPDLYHRPRGDITSKLAAINPGDKLTLGDLQRKYDASRKAMGRDGEENKLNKVHSHKGYLLVRASEMRQPERPDHFLRQFGQSDRTLISGGTTDGHVPQILTMFNGPISHKLLYEGTVIYDEVASAETMKDKVDVIFLSILTRHPTRLDQRIAMREIDAEGPAGVGNLIWALLNTREFMFVQ